MCYSGQAREIGVGICRAGVETCVRGVGGAVQWGPCAGERLPEAEQCDNQDRDCDGFPNNRRGGCALPFGTIADALGGYEVHFVSTDPEDAPRRYGNAILTFDNVGGGLEARGGALTGFAVCGEDKKFAWAKAEIHGDKIFLSSPEVSKPLAVRYGWADYPVVNLFNQEGLPASPFRTGR